MADGIVVLNRRARHDDHFGRTFPAMEATLTKADIKDYKLEKALRRFGKALAKQMAGGKFDSGATVVGVKLLSINFIMLTEGGRNGSW
jgi:hypothetical protein